MPPSLPELFREQWEFLATMAALAEPVSIDFICELAPLRPGPLFDLLGKLEPPGWIRKTGQDHFVIGPGLSNPAREKIANINNPKRLSELANRIMAADMLTKINTRTLVDLLDKAGRKKEAGLQAREMSNQTLKQQDLAGAQSALKSSLNLLLTHGLDNETTPLFISGTLQLSDLCFSLGRDFSWLEDLLHGSQDAARSVGDKLSHALLALHLGRLYYFSGRQVEAMIAFSLGLNEVEELGDSDILMPAAEFIGLNYFFQGRFREAMDYFERNENAGQSQI